MSRWIVPKTTGLKAAAGEPSDGPLARIAKYIPGEVVSAFTMVAALVAALKLDSPEPQQAAVFLIGIFLLTTVVYVVRNTSGPVRTAHLIVSPPAFLAWSYPISSSLLGHWFVPLYALLGQAAVIALSIAVQPREP
jgi:hypothetical protein